MNAVIVTLSIVIVVCLILILLVATYNHFQDYIIRINEADENIDAVLRKRFDLLNKSIGIIKTNIKSEEDVLEGIVKLRSKKLTNFELDRNLYDAINEFHVIKEKYPELQTNEEFIKIDIDKLNDEDYLANYAREHYLYSKDGEYIIQIDDIEDIEENITDEINKNYLILGLSILMILIFIYIISKGKRKTKKNKK